MKTQPRQNADVGADEEMLHNNNTGISDAKDNGLVDPLKPGTGIDHSRQRYPYCLVWSPLGPLTWFFPFVGHTGICDSRGIIHDFAGPYTIGVYFLLLPYVCN
jgi:hypothetical protein